MMAARCSASLALPTEPDWSTTRASSYAVVVQLSEVGGLGATVVGGAVVGSFGSVGPAVGAVVSCFVGLTVGAVVGCFVGLTVGAVVGCFVGLAVGAVVGCFVGLMWWSRLVVPITCGTLRPDR